MNLRFLDTNVLLYSISEAPAEAAKRDRALTLIAARNNALSVQVLQEFYVQATRATRPHPLPHADAVDLIRTWLRFKVQETTIGLVAAALDIKAMHHLSYWDAAIIAAARTLGCRELMSEDMAHGQIIGGVTIINPFR